MTGRTSIIRPGMRSKTPFGISRPHLVKLSGAVRVLESLLLNTEFLPSCANGSPSFITPICVSEVLRYDA
jgi:hypothetical protein